MMFEPADGTLQSKEQITGLKYIVNYISKGEEQELVALIDKQPWLSELKRRVLHYGAINMIIGIG